MKHIFKPVTAITMGDPAGIGPEIVVGTMLSEEVHSCCRPFVIGSKAIMEKAAKVLGKELKYNLIQIRQKRNMSLEQQISLRRVIMIQILLSGAKSSLWRDRWRLTGL